MIPTRPRTIVFQESAAAMGGVQFSTFYLASALDRARWTPIVICPVEGDLTNACRQAGIETHVVSYPRLWSTSVRLGRESRLPNPFAWLWNAASMVVATRRLKTRLHEIAPDVLVTKGLASHFIGGLAARGLRVPCIWHVQDLISERTFGIYRRILGLAAGFLPREIIVDGAAIKQQLPASLHSRVSVVHNGVNTRTFRPDLDGSAVRREFGISADAMVIGHAARLTPWKGQHFLIKAFAEIAEAHPNAVLLFAGSPVFDHDAYERRLRAMAVDVGLKDRIVFAGYRHDLPDVLAAMDVFAFTSVEKDTSPLSLLSAMACGLPIVAFDIQGVRELIDHEEEMLVTAPVADHIGLSLALRRLLADENDRARLGHAARRTAEKKFSLERFVNQFASVISNAGATTPELAGQPAGNLSRDITAAPGSSKSSAVSAAQL